MESSNRMLIITVLSLFAVSLLVSMSAMSLFSTLLVLIMAWMAFKWREQQATHRIFYSTGFDWFFVFWLVIIALGFVFNGTETSPWLKRIWEFNWILIFYACSAALIYTNPSEKLLTPAAVVSLLCALYAVVIYFLGFDPLVLPEIGEKMHAFEGQFRTGGFFKNPMTFAHVYALLFCFLFGMFLYLAKWKDSRFWIFAAALLFVGLGILFSFTRGAWLALVIAVPFMGFFFRKRLGAAIIIALILGLSGMRTFWPAFNDRVEQALNWEQNYDSERVAIWQANIEIFKDHPVVGVGYGENKTKLPEYYQKLGIPEGTLVSHAHNQFLHFLAGTGSLGLLVYLIIVLLFFRLTVKTLWAIPDRDFFHKGLVLGSLGAQVALQVGGITEANFEHSKVKLMMCMVWAIVVWLAYEYKVLRS